MPRAAVPLALAALGSLALAPVAPAKRVILTVPYAFRVATFDAVVVGTVTAVSDRPEKALVLKGDEREMRFATVKITSAVLGDPGATAKVGFFVPTAARRLGRPPARQSSAAHLTKGQEACLFLTTHPTRKNVFYLTSAADVLGAEFGTDWKKDFLTDVKRHAALLASPVKSLGSKDAGERLLAAALLIERYKTPNATGQTEPVPARETKHLLTALAGVDWDRGDRRNYKLNARALFFQLGATAKDGWVPPKEYAEIAPAAKAWLKANASKFKMTRFVRAKVSTELSEEPGK